MRLIRAGGTNARLDDQDIDYDVYGFGNYFMLQIKPEIDEFISMGKTVAVCVAAKPNKHDYDQRFVNMGFDLDGLLILGREDVPKWDLYDIVLLLGGETRELYLWLTKMHFSLDELTRCEILGGDSAGAYVLSGKTLIRYTSDGESFDIVEGFVPKLNQLIVGHTNNPRYHQDGLGLVLTKWCRENNVEYAELQENEIDVREI